MIPEKIGRYEIKGELGRGGMATVYRGYDPRFKREVAIKVLPREFQHDPQFRARFEREAEVIAALEHPAIVPVHDYGEDAEAGQPYIVMRLMTGGSLAERLEKGPATVTETARIFNRIAPALDRAHARGIIHRDLKPGNILFDDDDNPYISDFGIAKLTEGGSTFTGSGVVGTPAYMSPEQARGEKHIDGRSDIYALGAIVFQMLTGKFPYEADTPMGIIVKHITDPVPHILDANAELPSGCEDLIQKAMAKRPADRFPKAVDMSGTLDSIATGTYTPAVVPPTLQVDRATVDAATRVVQQAQDAKKAEQERIARERAEAEAKAEQERIARERAEAERLAKERAARAEAERIAKQAARPEAERTVREKAETGPTPKRQPTIEAAARQTIATPKLAEAPTRKPGANTGLIIGGAVVIMLCVVGGIPAIAVSINTLRSARQTATPVQMAIPATGIAGSSNEQIAFVSKRDGNSEIYTMRLDGSALTRITNNPAEDVYPAWSPDGSKLAFASNRDGNFEIYISDSSGLTRVTNNPADDLYPAWSADGGKLAFASYRDGNFEIYISDSTGLTRVTNNPADDLYPDWSPDGGKLAFASNRDGNFEIYINDSTGLTRVTNNSADDLYPAWSPDGGKLAFASNRDGNSEIYISDSSGLTRVTNNSADDLYPAWSPDGGKLAFASDRDGNFEIYISASSGLTRMTNNATEDTDPAWHP